MSDIAIKIENLSKQYRLGNVGTGTLSHDLKRWWANIQGKEDPTLQIGMKNKLAESGGDYVYALKDINLELKQGEILGVIGKNGAGKSTLLKILSKVTSPTTGTIDMYGRVASLLEVGTGFHPELTGQENIFLNGAIMGMTKKEIKNRFEEIVEFSGVGKYIDTPVKRYSSGMYVRLAFAVAAHLEPEILIVDEVLAVGDSEFQKKAIGKMQDVSKDGGRTVLFVSHNMATIEALCNRSIVLKEGLILDQGDTRSMVSKYLQTITQQTTIDLEKRSDRTGTGIIKFKRLIFENGIGPNSFKVGEDITIRIFASNNYSSIKKARFSISINSTKEMNLISCDSDLIGELYEIPANGDFSFACKLLKPPLNIGDYLVNVALYVDDIPEDWITSAAMFSIEVGMFEDRKRANHMPVLSKFEWKVN